MRSYGILLSLTLLVGACSQGSTQRSQSNRPGERVPELARGTSSELVISQPFTYENLTVYAIAFRGNPGHRNVMTLEKALRDGQARVVETGDVNQLEVENLCADTALFIQAGEIVRGGKQDRVMATDVLVEPQSGKVPIGAFCVERGRWSVRGDESDQTFHQSNNIVGSNSMKASILNDQNQGKVWHDVARSQQMLTASVGEDVADNTSASSLELSLENNAIRAKTDPYIAALSVKIEEQEDAIGLVVAINGKLHNADVYESNPLFSTLLPKLLAASATEAIAQINGSKTESVPAAADVRAFLNSAEDAEILRTQESHGLRTIVREGKDYCFWESLREGKKGDWIHRSYIVKPQP